MGRLVRVVPEAAGAMVLVAIAEKYWMMSASLEHIERYGQHISLACSKGSKEGWIITCSSYDWRCDLRQDYDYSANVSNEKFDIVSRMESRCKRTYANSCAITTNQYTNAAALFLCCTKGKCRLSKYR